MRRKTVKITLSRGGVLMIMLAAILLLAGCERRSGFETGFGYNSHMGYMLPMGVRSDTDTFSKDDLTLRKTVQIPGPFMTGKGTSLLFSDCISATGSTGLTWLVFPRSLIIRRWKIISSSGRSPRRTLFPRSTALQWDGFGASNTITTKRSPYPRNSFKGTGGALS